MKLERCVCPGFDCSTGRRALKCHPHSAVAMGFFSKTNPSNPDGGANNQPDNTNGSSATKKPPAKTPCTPPGKATACPAPKKRVRKPRPKCGRCAKLARKKKSKMKKCGRKAKKMPLPRSINPFMIYFMEQVRKNPKKKVTQVAKEAGETWCSMTPCDKLKYKKIADKEKIRLKKCMRKKK